MLILQRQPWPCLHKAVCCSGLICHSRLACSSCHLHETPESVTIAPSRCSRSMHTSFCIRNNLMLTAAEATRYVPPASVFNLAGYASLQAGNVHTPYLAVRVVLHGAQYVTHGMSNILSGLLFCTPVHVCRLACCKSVLPSKRCQHSLAAVLRAGRKHQVGTCLGKSQHRSKKQRRRLRTS